MEFVTLAATIGVPTAFGFIASRMVLGALFATLMRTARRQRREP